MLTTPAGAGRTAPEVHAARLTPAKTLVLQLNALSGKSRLPRKYRKLGKVPTGVVLENLATTYRDLPAAQQAALAPFFLQPRYRQSAWSRIARPNSRRSAHAAADDPCAGLESVGGGWRGIETAHAWFWYRTSSARGRARALAAEFDRKIWPKLTGAFRTVEDGAAAACDPVGDSKLDIYLTPPGNAILKAAGGVAPVIPVGDSCGPLPSFILLPETATRWTLAHEFMHTIQWAYRSCERHPAWVEGTASWAGDYVYPKDQGEHRWKTGTTAPFVSLLTPSEGGYESWPFWYSLTKKDGVDAIKRVFDALATRGFSSALESGPGDGLREAWKRYAVERWNASPIGASGFPVKKSLKNWDSFGTKPGGVPTEKVTLGGRKTKTFELKTSTQGPLSTWFDRATIDDRRVRQVQFKNADFGKPGSVVQAFIKLANGRWRLEDWSDRGAVSFCRDRANENVVQLVVASSNASAGGAPLGVVKHKLVAKNRCGLPTRFDGTWTRVFTDNGRGSWRVTVTGNATFVRTTDARAESGTISYGLTSSSVQWTVSGSQPLGGGCTYTFSGSGSASGSPKPPTELSLEDVSNHPQAPRSEPKPFYYSIWVSGDESKRPEYDVTSTCDGESETFKDNISPYFHRVGFRDWWSGVPPEIMKTDEPTLLEGHRAYTESTGRLTTDDTWRFEGSE